MTASALPSTNQIAQGKTIDVPIIYKYGEFT